jgi:hypothetical protein
MADNLPTVTIPAFSYDVKPMDIGAGYAKGITAAGEGIAKGITGALDVANRRQNASDLLTALHQGGILDDKVYKSVFGKSLGAQEQLLGMYANQWILDQANKRQMSLEQGKGGVDVAVQHAKMLDLINYTRSPTGKPGGAAWSGPQQQQPQPQPQFQYSTPAVGAAAQTAQQYGARAETLPPMQPATQQNQPAAQAQTSGGDKPPLPGSRRVVDNVTGKKGWQLPSGQTIPD